MAGRASFVAVGFGLVGLGSAGSVGLGVFRHGSAGKEVHIGDAARQRPMQLRRASDGNDDERNEEYDAQEGE